MTYAELQQDILAFIDNQDIADKVPTFIRLTENRINRSIRTRDMEQRVTATIGTQFSTLPSGFLEMRNIQINSQPVIALQYITPQEADRIRARELQGKPQYFSVVANRLELIPVPQESYTVEMVYFQKVPALSDSMTSNWLLERHYDLYLYGACVQAALYLKDDPTTWATLFDSALGEIEIENTRSQFQGTTPQVRGVVIG